MPMLITLSVPVIAARTCFALLSMCTTDIMICYRFLCQFFSRAVQQCLFLSIFNSRYHHHRNKADSSFAVPQRCCC
ncbi:hypothetical protein BKA60DRAFT_566240 [Fusarium oxysporum]|nr:hypothetical protein BKA60DRAFT_566240 [Fusarium oxysporum]